MPKVFKRAVLPKPRRKKAVRSYSKPVYGTGSEYGGMKKGQPTSVSKSMVKLINQNLVEGYGENVTASLKKLGYDNVEVILTFLQTGDLKQWTGKIE